MTDNGIEFDIDISRGQSEYVFFYQKIYMYF